MIGIICAMQEEISEILKLASNTSYEKIHNMQFVKGVIGNSECVLALCGVGKVHAAMCAQTMIIKYNPDIIVNVGVAGGIANELEIGDIVVANAVVQHDFDVSGFTNRKKGEISGLDLIEIPCTEWLSNNLLNHAQNLPNLTVHSGIIVSGDQFINNGKKAQELYQNFNGMACEMEAGSIGQVCYINGKEYSIVRAISDKANSSSNVDFDKFIQYSSQNAANILNNFIISYQG